MSSGPGDVSCVSVPALDRVVVVLARLSTLDIAAESSVRTTSRIQAYRTADFCARSDQSRHSPLESRRRECVLKLCDSSADRGELRYSTFGGRSFGNAH